MHRSLQGLAWVSRSFLRMQQKPKKGICTRRLIQSRSESAVLPCGQGHMPLVRPYGWVTKGGVMWLLKTYQKCHLLSMWSRRSQMRGVLSLFGELGSCFFLKRATTSSFSLWKLSFTFRVRYKSRKAYECVTDTSQLNGTSFYGYEDSSDCNVGCGCCLLFGIINNPPKRKPWH